ncbi:hypothetical protein JCM10908_002281 [Rhodotorula pacifica]|uniref:hybrid sensor histidine kinase/response regulator n=1 Tax=Rhodotorula pacifica TaxID=1495444 RepID=UPI0031756761
MADESALESTTRPGSHSGTLPPRRASLAASSGNSSGSRSPEPAVANGQSRNGHLRNGSSHARRTGFKHVDVRQSAAGEADEEVDFDGQDDDVGEEEEESFADWLERYRIGCAGPSDRTPVPPPSIRAILEGRTPDDPLVASPRMCESPSQSSIRTTSTARTSASSLPSLSAITAATLLDFYRRKGHFPAPPGPFEEERLRLAHKYGLDQPVRRQAIDRTCALAKAYFKTKTVVISLTFDDHQVLGAEKGWGGEEPGLEVPPRPLTMEPAFCTHAMLSSYKDPKAVFIVGDADRDWRFKGNPYSVGNGGGVAFYAAANVNLPVPDHTRKHHWEDRPLPATLASGAVCLIDPIPRAPESFSAEDRQVLTGFADMISLEFQRGYEQRRREQESQQSDFIGRFLRQALVLPAQPYEARVARGADDAEGESAVVMTAARQIRRLTHAGSAAILDLRAFKAKDRPMLRHASNSEPFTHPEGDDDSYQAHVNRPGFSRSSTLRSLRRQRSSTTPSPATWVSDLDQRGFVTVLSSDGDLDWVAIEEESDRIANATDATLQAYYAVRFLVLPKLLHPQIDQADQCLPCAQHSAASPEESTVDASAFVNAGLLDASKAGASIAVPVFDDDGSPILLIMLTSGEKWFTFESVDRQFVSSVGAIVVGSMLRQRALEADQAKLRFVGHVSHELRTPLHGCTSQIDLIREFASPQELRKLAPLLDAADVCLESLSDVLNDTLDFSKLTNTAALSPTEVAAQQMRALIPTDLQSLVEGVTKSVWVRKRRVDVVSVDVEHRDEPPVEQDKVDLILEVEERESGWRAMADVGGLKRCLLNVVGNSLKFTHAGSVKITLRDAGVIPSAPPLRYSPPLEEEVERRLVTFTITDSGIGMTDDFVRDRKYLTPFVQADPFVSGAGLGLSIVDSIIRRMGGKLEVTSRLGVGTTIILSLPLDVIVSSSAKHFVHPNDSPGRTIVRNISAELAQMLPARSHDEPTQLSTMDFETAVHTTQESLRSTSTSKRPLRPVLARQASERADQEALVVDVAKLTFSNAVTTPSANLVPMRDPLQPASPTSKAASKPEGERRKVRVLIAEDNPISRNILIKLLTGKGIPFSAAEDGQEALEAFEAGEGSYNLFLADVQMPRLDGIAASKAIRKVEAERGWPHCHIIALTGLSNEADMQKTVGKEGPFDSWLVKGGKSLRAILDAVYALQERLDAEE